MADSSPAVCCAADVCWSCGLLVVEAAAGAAEGEAAPAGLALIAGAVDVEAEFWVAWGVAAVDWAEVFVWHAATRTTKRAAGTRTRMAAVAHEACRKQRLTPAASLSTTRSDWPHSDLAADLLSEPAHVRQVALEVVGAEVHDQLTCSSRRVRVYALDDLLG